MTKHIAVLVDEENNAEVWWDALRETYPVFARALQDDGHAVIAESLWAKLTELPGFYDGPEYAQSPLIDCDSNSDQWCDVVASAHSVFENLT